MLKQTSDGLSKVWQSERCHEPFYRGGKLEVIASESKIVCMYDEDLRIVDLSTGERRGQLSEDSESDSNEVVTCFCMHPNGDEVVVSTQNFLLRHYKNLSTDKTCARVIRGHTMPVLTMAYDSTGTLIATGSADRTVRVWDVEKGYCTHNFRDHTDIVQTVYFHPDPNRLLLFSCSEDTTIRIFDLLDNSSVACFRDHMSLPTSITLSPDGYLLASAGRDKVLNFFELRTYKHLKTVPLMDELEGVVILNEEHSRMILNIEEPSSKKKGILSEHVLITAGSKGVIRILRVSFTGKDISSFTCQTMTELNLSPSSSGATSSLYAVRGLYYLPNKGEIAAVTSDHNFCYYKIHSRKADGVCLTATKQVNGCNDDILDILVIPRVSDSDSTPAITTESEDTDNGHNTHNTHPTPTLPISGEKRFSLAVITNSPQIRLVDEGFACTPLDGHTDIVLAADVSPDGRWLCTSSKDRTCRVWDLLHKRCVAIGEGHADAVGSVCVSQRLATYASKVAFMISGAGDKILKRWPLPVHSFSSPTIGFDGKESYEVLKLAVSHNVRGHDKDINTLAISPNDSMCASGSQDKSIRLWRTSDLAPIASLTGHKRGIWKIIFSPVDRCLASCSGDRTIRLWSVVDYTCLRVFEGHTASVLTVKFANKGMQLLSGAADGLIKLWTIRSGECENTFDLHSDRVWALAVGHANSTPQNNTDNMFFSGGSDSKLLVWSDATQSEETKRLDEAEQGLLAEQQLQNDIRNKRYDRALAGALTLGHSNKVLNIFMAVLDEDKEKEKEEKDAITNKKIKGIKGSQGSEEHSSKVDAKERSSKAFQLDLGSKLDVFVASWSDADLEKVVSYLKEWNTNAKHSFVSQAVLNSVIRVVRTERLMSVRSISESIPGLLAYSERHFSRVDRLHQATYVLEYMSSLMSLLPLEDSRLAEDTPIRKNPGVNSKIGTAVSTGATGAESKGKEVGGKEAPFLGVEKVPVIFATIPKVPKVKAPKSAKLNSKKRKLGK